CMFISGTLGPCIANIAARTQDFVMTLGRYKRAWRNEWLGVDAGQQLIFTLGRPRFAMQEVLTNIAAGVLGVPLYLSGLFVWPVWSFQCKGWHCRRCCQPGVGAQAAPSRNSPKCPAE